MLLRLSFCLVNHCLWLGQHLEWWWHCYINVWKVVFHVDLWLSVLQLKIDLRRDIVILVRWLVLWLRLVMYFNVINYWLLLAHLNVAIEGSLVIVL